MKRKHINECEFTLISLFGKPVIMTDSRIDQTSIPEGLFSYEIRHADDDWSEPCEISRDILCNYLCTIVTNSPIPVDLKECDLILHQNDESPDIDWMDLCDINVYEYINMGDQRAYSIPTERVIHKYSDGLVNAVNSAIGNLE